MNAEKYNEDGDFTIEIDSLKQTVFNDNIKTDYVLTIRNNKKFEQKFVLDIDEKAGWDIFIDNKEIDIASGEEEEININFKITSDFDYGTSVISPGLIKIAQKNNYIGSFEFPLVISGENENVTLKLRIDIDKKEKLNEVYTPEFATSAVSPKMPLNFGIRATNLQETQNTLITLKFAGEDYKFQDTFTSQNNYKIYSQKISSEIDPGVYSAQIIVRVDKNDVSWEWEEKSNITVNEYKELSVEEDNKKSLILDTYVLKINNLGNVNQDFEYKTNVSAFKRLLLTSNIEYEKDGKLITFKTNLQKGETKEIVYKFNYLPVYIVILGLIVLFIFIYIKKNSNPLDIETEVYEVKKVEHEGIKSVKIRIGFENIKEDDIENLRLIFRMPGYLNIKESSFLLREPNHVLKGKNQYKLVWEFKKFAQNDSRIIGFQLINKRGVLGDIRLPSLEIETKVDGKIKKYYKSFPTIKG